MKTQALLTHRVNRSISDVRWPSDDARVWVSELVQRAWSDPAFLAVVVHGSAARDVHKPDDLDLLLVHRGARLTADPPLDVDLRMYTDLEADIRIAAGDEVLASAVRLGIPVLDRDGFWSVFVERWRERMPAPSAAEAEQRAALAQRAADDFLHADDPGAAAEMRLTAMTQLARARLINAGVLPLSRPELPIQLLGIGQQELAAELERAVASRY